MTDLMPPEPERSNTTDPPTSAKPDNPAPNNPTAAEPAIAECPPSAQQGTEVPTKRKPAEKLDWNAFPHKPRSLQYHLPTTIENVEFLLAKAGIHPRYDEMKKRTVIELPEEYKNRDNQDATAMALILSLASLNGMPTGLVPQFVDAIGAKNAFNPIANWILSVPWDSIDRLPDLAATLTLRKDYPAHFAALLLRKFLLSAVAAVLLPSGFRSRGVLVLQGPQSIGKTKWVQQLMPAGPLRDAYMKVDHHLDPTNKDSVLGAITHWIIELGELESSFKKEIDRLKGFLTSPYDKVRRPYGRTEAEHPRRSVFAATVNQHSFLVDPTGNTRWWTIAVDKLDYEHTVDMQQVFAQLAVALNAGETWWLTPEEEAQLEAINLRHQSPSAIEELILAHFDMSLIGKHQLTAMTASEVLRALGFDKPTNAQAKECAAVLRRLLGEPKHSKGIRWRIPATFDDKGRMNPVSEAERKWGGLRPAAST